MLPKRKNRSRKRHSNKTGLNHLEFDSEKIPYKPPTQYLFLDEKRKLDLAKSIRKQMDKFDLNKEDLGFVTS